MTRVRRFGCQPRSVTAARGFVRDTLSDQARDVVDAAELMACELATNSVRHAHTDFEIAIRACRGEIRVEVRDAGRGRPKLRSPTAHESSGRGLRIVQALSSDWGVLPACDSTCVWFSISCEDGARAAREPMSCA